MTTPTPSLLLPPGPITRTFHILPTGELIPTGKETPAIPPLFISALKVRAEVFLIEQQCPAAKEIDADDAVSWHWVIHGLDPSGQEVPAATIRLIPAQRHADAEDEKAAEGPNYAGSRMWDHEEPYVMIGRLATIRKFRGRGYGRVLVEAALGFAGSNANTMVKDWNSGEKWKGLAFAHAQKEVEKWYASMGWETDEGMGVWWEEGIEHVGMWIRVNVSKGTA